MPTIMCTRNLWRAIGGGAALPVRGGGVVGETKLGGWSLRELPTRDGNLVVGLEETTYLTILCPLLPQPAFVGVFSAAERWLRKQRRTLVEEATDTRS